jgi:hypothetical protein
MKGGQASSEDLLPLGYGERDRVGVRVRAGINPSQSPFRKGRSHHLPLRKRGIKGDFSH